MSRATGRPFLALQLTCSGSGLTVDRLDTTSESLVHKGALTLNAYERLIAIIIDR